jgi:Holliday junction resolvasome RuvABC endonuclease subunit
MKGNTYHVQLICPDCGRKSTYTMKTLIDTGEDPYAEKKLFSGALFSYTCPFCRQQEDISYSCLYHNQAEKVLIGYADTEKDEAEMRLNLNGSYHRDQLDEVLKDWTASCITRVVTSINDLQEKALIFHFNLDDRLIEIAKYMTKMIAEEQQPDLRIEKLYFNHDEKGYSFVIVNEEGSAGEIPFSKENYLLLERKYSRKLMDVKELSIDEAWAQMFVRQMDAA